MRATVSLNPHNSIKCIFTLCIPSTFAELIFLSAGHAANHFMIWLAKLGDHNELFMSVTIM